MNNQIDFPEKSFFHAIIRKSVYKDKRQYINRILQQENLQKRQIQPPQTEKPGQGDRVFKNGPKKICET